MRNYLPIRKLAVAALGAALVWLARRNGLDLGTDQANEAAIVIVALVFGYAERDPRVKQLERRVGDVLDADDAGDPSSGV